jgi:Restriction Endonuclease associating with ARP
MPVNCERRTVSRSNPRNVAILCRQALHQSLVACSPGVMFDPQRYVVHLRDNLVPGIELDDIRTDFDTGAGYELRSKMRAPHSSSALVVNMFGRWRRDPSSLCIQGETGFESLTFEARCSSGLGGTSPHLDMLAVSRDAVVAVESKCLEYLQEKRPVFSRSYDTIADARARSAFFKLVPQLRTNAHEFRSLDVAQLVKHYLGLTNCWPDKRLTLLYLYWEPENAGNFDQFAEHRREIEHFCKLVGFESNFTFRAACHRELWAEWEIANRPEWIRNQVQQLRLRYDVLI